MKPRLLVRTLTLCAGLGLALVWLGTERFDRGGPPVAPRSDRPVTTRGETRAATAPAAATITAGFSAPALLAYVAPPLEAAAIEAALSAPTDRIYYVRLNRALLEGKQSPFWQKRGAGRFELPLPDGRSLPVVIDATELLGADRFTSQGRLEGRPGSRAIFGYNEGVLHAMIEDLDLGMFTLRYANGDVAQFFHVDEAKVPPCGGGLCAPVDYQTIRETALRKQPQASQPATGADTGAGGTAGPALFAAADATPSRATTDVMMLATRAVLNSLSGANAAAKLAALQSAFDTAIAKVNSDFVASQIAARVRLVRVEVVDYSDDGGGSVSQSTALSALRTGGIANVATWRDQYGADLVCLSLLGSDSQSSGIASIMAAPSLADTRSWTTNPSVGYSVVQYSLINSSRVVSHELGHNFGCAHAHGDSLSTGTKDGAYEYSYGYRFTDTRGRRWRTIMAYDASPGYSGIAYFSNPRLTPPEIGVPVGGPVQSYVATDNAQTITLDAFEVSTFRTVADRPYGQGTMVNVSTRAFVGMDTDQRALVGGFAIQGPAAKTVLIRAQGPSLAQYGVQGVLANPMIVLHSLPGNAAVVQIAENDNWTTGTPSSSAQQIAATGLAPQSILEPAILITLQPGNYTATVTGANNGTGNGIVEVFEAGSGNNRLINLSTRGYVGSDAEGKTMIGGFVVSGPAGTTKRVLLRALGPTLANYGINGALSDPMIELYNSRSELVLKNDDFGTSARSADGSNPIISTYAQSQVLATGLAPPNRREPCVMLDLEPGLYTVMLKPFELLTDTPPQVAQPGIGLIEVYEIADR